MQDQDWKRQVREEIENWLLEAETVSMPRIQMEMYVKAQAGLTALMADAMGLAELADSFVDILSKK